MKEINSLGTNCPQPIIDLGRALKDADQGEVVMLLSDDPATEIDLRAWERMTGNHVEVLGKTTFQITKKSESSLN